MKPNSLIRYRKGELTVSIKVLLSLVTMAVIALTIANGRFLVGAFYNNLGSIGLSRHLPATRPQALEASQADFERAISWSSSNASAYRSLGRVFYERGSFLAAVHVLEKALYLSPSDRWARFWLGNAYAAAGMEQPAIAAWRKAEARDYFYVGGARYLALGDAVKAESWLRRAVAIDPSSTGAHMLLAYILWGKGNREDALSFLNKVLDLEREGSAEWYFALGEKRRVSMDWDGAFDAYQKAVQLDPSSSKYWYRAGLALYRSGGTIDEVMHFLGKAIETDPQNISTYLVVGDIYLAQANYSEAERWYLKVEEVSAESEYAPLFLGKSALARGALEDAHKHLTQALTRNRHNADVHYYLGLYYKAKGNLREAAAELETAVQLSPATGYYLGLAETYQQIGDYLKALRIYQRMLEIDPDNATAREQIDLLEALLQPHEE